MKKFLLLSLLAVSTGAIAQKPGSLYFDLYTDSLKKGVHNYINVIGKLPDGSFYPLMANEVSFSSSGGRWEGNSLIIDSAYTGDSIVVQACLKESALVKQSITIYMKRNLIEPPLKTEQELLEEWKRSNKKKH